MLAGERLQLRKRLGWRQLESQLQFLKRSPLVTFNGHHRSKVGAGDHISRVFVQGVAKQVQGQTVIFFPVGSQAFKVGFPRGLLFFSKLLFEAVEIATPRRPLPTSR